MRRNASTLLLADTAPVWEAIRQHLVVRGIADASLPSEQFDFWVQQDFHYAAGARRFLSLLIARTAEQDVMERLGQGMLTLGEELDLFQRHARARGFSIAAERAPTCEAYVNFLINSAVHSFEVGFAVLFAAERAFLDVWRSIRARSIQGNPYQMWIDHWTTPEFAAYVSWIEATLNRQVDGWPERALEPLRRAFRQAARYEYLFWDMVAQREAWPI